MKDNAESSEPEEAQNPSGAMRASRRDGCCPALTLLLIGLFQEEISLLHFKLIPKSHRTPREQTRAPVSLLPPFTRAGQADSIEPFFSGGGPQPQAERPAAPRAGPGVPPSL